MAKYNIPNAYNGGFVLPDYVQAEPPERGTFTTAMLPRGTISAVIPPLIATPIAETHGLGSLGGCTLAGNSLAGNTLTGNSLAGDTLGAQEYQLESLSGMRNLPRRGSSRAVNQSLGAVSVSSLASDPKILIAAALGAYLLLRKKKRSKR
jgi:hypothetical protein